MSVKLEYNSSVLEKYNSISNISDDLGSRISSLNSIISEYKNGIKNFVSSIDDSDDWDDVICNDFVESSSSLYISALDEITPVLDTLSGIFSLVDEYISNAKAYFLEVDSYNQTLDERSKLIEPSNTDPKYINRITSEFLSDTYNYDVRIYQSNYNNYTNLLSQMIVKIDEYLKKIMTGDSNISALLSSLSLNSFQNSSFQSIGAVQATCTILEEYIDSNGKNIKKVRYDYDDGSFTIEENTYADGKLLNSNSEKHNSNGIKESNKTVTYNNYADNPCYVKEEFFDENGNLTNSTFEEDCYDKRHNLVAHTSRKMIYENNENVYTEIKTDYEDTDREKKHSTLEVIERQDNSVTTTITTMDSDGKISSVNEKVEDELGIHIVDKTYSYNELKNVQTEHLYTDGSRSVENITYDRRNNNVTVSGEEYNKDEVKERSYTSLYKSLDDTEPCFTSNVLYDENGNVITQNVYEKNDKYSINEYVIYNAENSINPSQKHCELVSANGDVTTSHIKYVPNSNEIETETSITVDKNNVPLAGVNIGRREDGGKYTTNDLYVDGNLDTSKTDIAYDDGSHSTEDIKYKSGALLMVETNNFDANGTKTSDNVVRYDENTHKVAEQDTNYYNENGDKTSRHIVRTDDDSTRDISMIFTGDDEKILEQHIIETMNNGNVTTTDMQYLDDSITSTSETIDSLGNTLLTKDIERDLNNSSTKTTTTTYKDGKVENSTTETLYLDGTREIEKKAYSDDTLVKVEKNKVRNRETEYDYTEEYNGEDTTKRENYYDHFGNVVHSTRENSANNSRTETYNVFQPDKKTLSEKHISDNIAGVGTSTYDVEYGDNNTIRTSKTNSVDAYGNPIYANSIDTNSDGAVSETTTLYKDGVPSSMEATTRYKDGTYTVENKAYKNGRSVEAELATYSKDNQLVAKETYVDNNTSVKVSNETFDNGILVKGNEKTTFNDGSSYTESKAYNQGVLTNTAREDYDSNGVKKSDSIMAYNEIDNKEPFYTSRNYYDEKGHVISQQNSEKMANGNVSVTDIEFGENDSQVKNMNSEAVDGTYVGILRDASYKSDIDEDSKNRIGTNASDENNLI